jgi:hypothetical protein
MPLILTLLGILLAGVVHPSLQADTALPILASTATPLSLWGMGQNAIASSLRSVGYPSPAISGDSMQPTGCQRGPQSAPNNPQSALSFLQGGLNDGFASGRLMTRLPPLSSMQSNHSVAGNQIDQWSHPPHDLTGGEYRCGQQS